MVGSGLSKAGKMGAGGGGMISTGEVSAREDGGGGVGASVANGPGEVDGDPDGGGGAEAATMGIHDGGACGGGAGSCEVLTSFVGPLAPFPLGAHFASRGSSISGLGSVVGNDSAPSEAWDLIASMDGSTKRPLKEESGSGAGSSLETCRPVGSVACLSVPSSAKIPALQSHDRIASRMAVSCSSTAWESSGSGGAANGPSGDTSVSPEPLKPVVPPVCSTGYIVP